ncbi:multi-copper polyphenol oxidoreductase laccase family protein, partial [Vibrio parahaemolyticus V-223/04]
CSTSVCRF